MGFEWTSAKLGFLEGKKIRIGIQIFKEKLDELDFERNSSRNSDLLDQFIKEKKTRVGTRIFEGKLDPMWTLNLKVYQCEHSNSGGNVSDTSIGRRENSSRNSVPERLLGYVRGLWKITSTGTGF